MLYRLINKQVRLSLEEVDDLSKSKHGSGRRRAGREG
jgi:hypothetical protein